MQTLQDSLTKYLRASIRTLENKFGECGLLAIDQFGARAGDASIFESLTTRQHHVSRELLARIPLITTPRPKDILRISVDDNLISACFLQQIFDRPIGYFWTRNELGGDTEEFAEFGIHIEEHIRDAKRLFFYNTLRDACHKIGASTHPISLIGNLIESSISTAYVAIWYKSLDDTGLIREYRATYTSDNLEPKILSGKGLVGWIFENPDKCPASGAIRVDDLRDAEQLRRDFNREIANAELINSRSLRSAIFVPLIVRQKTEVVVSLFFKRPFGATNVDEEIAVAVVNLFQGILGYPAEYTIFKSKERVWRRIAPQMQKTILIAQSIHDIKDDIASLRSLLSSVTGKTSDQELLLKRAREIVEDLRKHTTDLKETLSVFETSGRVEKFVLRDCIDTTCLGFESALSEAGIEIKTKISDGIVLRVPKRRLQRIVENALTNAIKALGTVTHRKKQIEISAVLANQNLSLGIADNGPGLEKKYVHVVFDPFFTTYEIDSSGLGLFIAKVDAEEMGAKIRVRTGWGKGFELLVEFSPDSFTLA